MDFNILHLSDLHIKDTENLQNNLEKLLDDIREQLSNIHKIIIVVTGDIIDIAKYNDKSINNTIYFFKTLKDIIGDKFESILMVPGNHDRVHCDMSNIILDNLRKQEKIENMTDDDWEYHLLSYKEFFDLEDKIYNIFYPDTILPICHSGTYGVEKFVNKESVIIFVKLDTSWCSLGGSQDKRKLHIFTQQLELLKREYQNFKKDVSGQRVLTIALCHHPLSWLTEYDEKLIYSYFTNEEYLNVDMILCGHVHDIGVNDVSNNFHQITTLFTGIGWKEETPSDKRNGHRYSIYIVNLRRNSCEAIVRKTDSNGNFDVDRDFLPDKKSKELGKLYIPIISHSEYPYIEIPVFTECGLKTTPLFIDKKILNDINLYSQKISSLHTHMNEKLYMQKQQALSDFVYSNRKNKIEKEALANYFDNGTNSKHIKTIFGNTINKTSTYTMFLNFLYEICNCFINNFKDAYVNTAKEDIRIFFRFLDIRNKNKITYKQVCQQSKSIITGEITHDDNNARDIEFGGLIEKAYKSKTPLVFSSNTWYNNLEVKKWNNFITIVPIYNKYEYTKDKIDYPLITCGISIKTNYQDPFLDILNYIGIQDTINDIIGMFLKAFQINVVDVVKYFYTMKGNGENNDNDTI